MLIKLAPIRMQKNDQITSTQIPMQCSESGQWMNNGSYSSSTIAQFPSIEYGDMIRNWTNIHSEGSWPNFQSQPPVHDCHQYNFSHIEQWRTLNENHTSGSHGYASTGQFPHQDYRQNDGNRAQPSYQLLQPVQNCHQYNFSQIEQWRTLNENHTSGSHGYASTGQFPHHDYRQNDGNRALPSYQLLQPVQDCHQYNFSQIEQWRTLNENHTSGSHGYASTGQFPHHDYRQNDGNRALPSYQLLQPVQDCHQYNFSQIEEWRTLNENHTSGSHGDASVGRFPYHDYREHGHSLAESVIHQNRYSEIPTQCSGSGQWIDNGNGSYWSTVAQVPSIDYKQQQNEQYVPHSCNLLMQNTVSSENYLSTGKSVSKSKVTASSSRSEVPDSSVHSLDATVAMKPKDQLGCDIRDMYMKTSDQSAKKLCCPFCQKLFIKLARHMEVKHYQQPDVQKFMKLPKGSKERRAIQDSLRKIGQDNFNKNAALNKKELIPSRRSNPKHNRKAVDQKTCPYCFGSYAKSGIHFHIKNKCPQKPIEDERTKGERVLPALTSSVERRYRENACPALQAVFDNCHNDDIVRGVRFDWLAIVYGNKLTLKYSKPRHRKMIKNRMRLIGRVLSALKIIEPEVTELARFLVPKYYDRVVEAIRTVARVDEVRNEFVAPATASSAVTAIRQICEMLIVEYIKQDDQENQRTTRDFLTVMNSDMHISINKMVNETQSRMARQRTVILPSSDDVKRLAQYLEAERTACYNELSQSYNFDSWKRLNELVMASIIIFNRRRVGDTENILDEDFARKEMINDDTSAELLSTLPEHSKQIATQYSRMKVRGKKNRTVPVLLKANIAECLELLISHRKAAGVSPLNNFLFGLPSKKDIYQVVDAGRILRKFAKACGAENPSLLTATNLRKHLATICVTLQLNDTSVADVAEFMGHAEKVHRDHYRQNPIERQIVQMSQVLEAAQGNLTVTNEDAVQSGQEHVNKGRKRKSVSSDLKGTRKSRRACKPTN